MCFFSLAGPFGFPWDDVGLSWPCTQPAQGLLWDYLGAGGISYPPDHIAGDAA